jgi:hypothetical protein
VSNAFYETDRMLFYVMRTVPKHPNENEVRWALTQLCAGLLYNGARPDDLKDALRSWLEPDGDPGGVDWYVREFIAPAEAVS